jgi:hypothetical protein
MICPRCSEETKQIVRGHCSSCYSILLRKGDIRKIVKQPIPNLFTTEQDEFFTGLMLGDGGLVWGKTNLYPRLSMSRQVKDSDYLFWQYEIFKDFYGTPPKYFKSFHKRVKKYYEGYGCRTRSGQIFKDNYGKW